LPPLVIGRVSGFRGNRGEATVKVASGDAARWEHVRHVMLNPAGEGAATVPRKVESARAYRDRLVLKLAGVDDASQAEALRGCDVLVGADDVPRLPEDVYWVARLMGARVTESTGRDIGCVADVIETGGTDLLRVVDAAGAETLVPLAREIVTEIDEAAGRIVVSLPEGLQEINAPMEREPA
jgi:16S rRNA processing protein RimM